jgi:hypothetical protein
MYWAYDGRSFVGNYKIVFPLRNISLNYVIGQRYPASHRRLDDVQLDHDHLYTKDIMFHTYWPGVYKLLRLIVLANNC